MHYKELAKDIWSKRTNSTFAPGFIERIRVAAVGNTQPRTIATPYYLTDLGIRRFEDPREFFELNVAKTDWDGLHSRQESVNLIRSADLDDLADMLDSYILLVGDYDGAQNAISNRLSGIEASRRPTLQIYAAVLLSLQSDRRSLTMFTHAAKHARTLPSKIMALHRRAAAEIKRFKDPQTGIETLRELDQFVRTQGAEGSLSKDDVNCILSLTSNLRALGYIASGEPELSMNEISLSVELATLDGLEVMSTSEAARYLAQGRINLAQSFLRLNENKKALDTLRNNVDFCFTHAQEYLSEALTTYAYGLYLSQDYTNSIEQATRAIGKIATEGSPTRLRSARKILIGALARSGNETAAHEELKNLDGDPLGQADTLTQRPKDTHC